MLFSVRWRGHPEDSLAQKHATLLAKMIMGSGLSLVQASLRKATEIPKALI